MIFLKRKAVGAPSPEVSPQKDGTYLLSAFGEMSDDSNLSESQDEDEKPNVLSPLNETKFFVFQRELKLFN